MADVVIPMARRLDLISLRPDAGRADVESLCREAMLHQCQAVCVPGSRVALAAALLEESEVKVSALVGFPFGNADGDVKRYEIEAALDAGAQEFDVVLNLGRLRDGDDAGLLRELRDLREAAEERPVKAVIELASVGVGDDLKRVVEAVMEAEWQFLVTATGCAIRPTTPEDLVRIREVAGPELGLKAVGLVHTRPEAEALVAAGANRIGVFQAGPFVAEA